ncbi:MAG TPA: NrdJb [Thiolapillus brandeum]|uniref:ribonucleoside-diphosphate reductase n=1 Tax=Thiolapillus brandeum TaxID=1076588 RepID=A0A831K3C3_9GAMM|nr:NrdJb [Thiolapillus brandeum]
MTIKLEQKITAYEVVGKDEPVAVEEKDDNNIIQMHEKVARPEMLFGSTYKIKTPQSDHALYVTINDMILNKDTAHEIRRPFEVFINSKNMDHYQWIVALTLIISAVFRKGGDVTFLVEELRSVFDPNGGYFKRGGKFMPSLVAEIGEVICDHLVMIGMIKEQGPDEHVQKILDAKREEFERNMSLKDSQRTSEFPEGAQLCKKCNTKAAIMMDGCLTCLNCGESKCG